MKTSTTCKFHQCAVDTFLARLLALAAVTHQRSQLPQLDRGEGNNKPVLLTVQFC